MSDISNFTPLWGVWEIESTIGEGNFGKVYKAVRHEFGRTYHCAIKHIPLPKSDAEVKQFLNEQLSDDKSIASDYYRDIVEDINNEIGIMHSLRGNTNVVAYEDHLIVPKSDGVGYDIFIRMELLTELSERVKQSAFTQVDVVKMGVDICTALEICAAKNLIHRDIKPQNIFINGEGNFKLGDFGVSRQLEKTTSGLSKKGTMQYMAPEVYKGQDYGANVDLYSLGLLMYRLLNGNRLPFLPLAPTPVRYDDSDKALAKRMQGQELPAPAFADESLTKIILKMCAYDRNERYRTATEAKAELIQSTSVQPKVVPIVDPIGDISLTNDALPASEEPVNIESNDMFDNDNEKTTGLFNEIPPVVQNQGTLTNEESSDAAPSRFVAQAGDFTLSDENGNVITPEQMKKRIQEQKDAPSEPPATPAPFDDEGEKTVGVFTEIPPATPFNDDSEKTVGVFKSVPPVVQTSQPKPVLPQTNNPVFRYSNGSVLGTPGQLAGFSVTIEETGLLMYRAYDVAFNDVGPQRSCALSGRCIQEIKNAINLHKQRISQLPSQINKGSVDGRGYTLVFSDYSVSGHNLGMGGSFLNNPAHPAYQGALAEQFVLGIFNMVAKCLLTEGVQLTLSNCFLSQTSVSGAYLGQYIPPYPKSDTALHVVLAIFTWGIGNLIYWAVISDKQAKWKQRYGNR